MRISILEELAKRVFTIENVLSTTNIQKEVLWVILSRLEKKGWIERIEKGKYTIIPLGAEKGRHTLNEFIIYWFFAAKSLFCCLLERTQYLWLDRAVSKYCILTDNIKKEETIKHLIKF
jgi:predicted transcriptional regulator of viral defense system